MKAPSWTRETKGIFLAETPPPMNQTAVSPDSAATVIHIIIIISSSSSSGRSSNKILLHPGLIDIKLGHSYAARADLNYSE
ncbi:hypothetical protein ACLKA7_016834 [Drosophila subpalustris]